MISRRMPPFGPDWAIFLDIDGTLLDFAADPREVRVEDGLIELLRRLHASTGGAVSRFSATAPATMPARTMITIRRTAGRRRAISTSI